MEFQEGNTLYIIVVMFAGPMNQLYTDNVSQYACKR